MSGGWVGSNRKAELPPDWAQRRAACKAAARGICQHIYSDTGNRCRRYGTDADHEGDPMDHSPGNLKWKCRVHHGKKSSAEGNAAKALIRARSTRPAEKHPGRL